MKVDTYVLETDAHFSTDFNLLWVAARKCVDWIEKLHATPGLKLLGWRKTKAWRAGQAVPTYLNVGHGLATKVSASPLALSGQLLRCETIPVVEKVFFFFEPPTEWIQKGKARPNVELGTASSAEPIGRSLDPGAESGARTRRENRCYLPCHHTLHETETPEPTSS